MLLWNGACVIYMKFDYLLIDIYFAFKIDTQSSSRLKSLLKLILLLILTSEPMIEIIIIIIYYNEDQVKCNDLISIISMAYFLMHEIFFFVLITVVYVYLKNRIKGEIYDEITRNMNKFSIIPLINVLGLVTYFTLSYFWAGFTGTVK